MVWNRTTRSQDPQTEAERKSPENGDCSWEDTPFTEGVQGKEREEVVREAIILLSASSARGAFLLLFYPHKNFQIVILPILSLMRI